MDKSKPAVRKAHFLLASVISLLVVGCGGSSGSQEPASPATLGELKVANRTPGDASNNANRNGPIEIVFDRELDPSTVIPEKLVLQNASGNISTNVAVAGNKLTVTLPQRLARATTYSFNAVGLKGKSGETLSGTRLLSFTTATEREWGNAVPIDVSASSSKPHISVDSNGNGVAAWRQNDGSSGAIHFNRYTREKGWGIPELLPGASGDVGRIQVAHIDDNHVLAVWPRLDTCCRGFYSSMYTVGSGWDTPQRIDSGYIASWGPINDPVSISTDHAGKALAVWSEFTGSVTKIQSRTFNVGQGWNVLTTVDFNQSRSDRPNASLNKSGEAFAAYTIQNIGWGTPGISAHARRYTLEGLWVDVSFYSAFLTEARFPQIVTDEAGNATFVWLQTDAAGKRVHAQRFSPSGPPPFDTDSVISDNSGDASAPQMVVDSFGNVTVVWSQSVDGTSQVLANRYTAATGWETAKIIATDTKYNGSDSPQIAVDKDGNVVVVWLVTEGANTKVYSRRFIPSRGWEDARVHRDSGNASNPQIAFGPAGDAMIIWESRDGASSKIFVSAFD